MQDKDYEELIKSFFITCLGDNCNPAWKDQADYIRRKELQGRQMVKLAKKWFRGFSWNSKFIENGE